VFINMAAKYFLLNLLLTSKFKNINLK